MRAGAIVAFAVAVAAHGGGCDDDLVDVGDVGDMADLSDRADAADGIDADSADGAADAVDVSDAVVDAAVDTDTADIADALPDSAPADVELTACEALFGMPNENTGLDETMCRPECSCTGITWAQPVYTPADVAALRALTLMNVPALLVADPYLDPAPAEAAPGTVCGVMLEGSGQYDVATFASAVEAVDSGAQVTHAGACGLCSSLADLAVYMETPDLTGPVRECGLQGIREGDARTRECLLELGFSPPCAEIWYYNTLHTRSVCARDCFALIDAPYHNDDGTLNACLQCDEDLSGPVFKAYAGRTRRNTGLATAMCRPCEEVLRVEHRYLEVE